MTKASSQKGAARASLSQSPPGAGVEGGTLPWPPTQLEHGAPDKGQTSKTHCPSERRLAGPHRENLKCKLTFQKFLESNPKRYKI